MSTQTPPNLDDLLRVLNAATDRASLQWTSTADEDTFRAQLSFGLVRLAKDPGTSRCSLTLVADDGTVLDEYQPSEEGTVLALQSLHKKARRQALNLDWKLQALYDELKSRAGES